MTTFIFWFRDEPIKPTSLFLKPRADSDTHLSFNTTLSWTTWLSDQRWWSQLIRLKSQFLCAFPSTQMRFSQTQGGNFPLHFSPMSISGWCFTSVKSCSMAESTGSRYDPGRCCICAGLPPRYEWWVTCSYLAWRGSARYSLMRLEMPAVGAVCWALTQAAFIPNVRQKNNKLEYCRSLSAWKWYLLQ